MQLETKKLFIGNLDSRVKRSHLKEFFSQYGEVLYTKVVYDRELKKSRCFGFVVFATEEDAANALEKGNNLPIVASGLSLSTRPIRLMYAEVHENKPIYHKYGAIGLPDDY